MVDRSCASCCGVGCSVCCDTVYEWRAKEERKKQRDARFQQLEVENAAGCHLLETVKLFIRWHDWQHGLIDEVIRPIDGQAVLADMRSACEAMSTLTSDPRQEADDD